MQLGQFWRLESCQPRPLWARYKRLSSNSSYPRGLLTAETLAYSVPQSLREATYIYLQKEWNRPPLAQLYEGPLAAISRGSKVFRLQVGHREVSVSVDHLKPHLGLHIYGAQSLQPEAVLQPYPGISHLSGPSSHSLPYRVCASGLGRPGLDIGGFLPQQEEEVSPLQPSYLKTGGEPCGLEKSAHMIVKMGEKAVRFLRVITSSLMTFASFTRL